MKEDVLPEGWEIKKLESLADILDFQRKPINSKEREKRIQGKSDNKLFPYYGATGEVGKIDDYLFNEELVALGEDGVPFLDFNKDKAYMLYGKTWVNNHAHVLRAKKGITENKFLYYFLNQFDYRNYVNGGIRLKLTQANMRKIPVITPPLPEQQYLSQKLTALFFRFYRLGGLTDVFPQGFVDFFQQRFQLVLQQQIHAFGTVIFTGLFK